MGGTVFQKTVPETKQLVQTQICVRLIFFIINSFSRWIMLNPMIFEFLSYVNLEPWYWYLKTDRSGGSPKNLKKIIQLRNNLLLLLQIRSPNFFHYLHVTTIFPYQFEVFRYLLFFLFAFFLSKLYLLMEICGINVCHVPTFIHFSWKQNNTETNLVRRGFVCLMFKYSWNNIYVN